jgi:hypothetical protein
MVSTIIEPDIPQWMQRYINRVDATYVNAFPKAPVRLWSVTQANLPPAAQWPGCIVYVSDKAKVGLSNGTTWTQTDGGAL